MAQGLSVKGSVLLATAAALPTNTYLSNVITITATGTLTVDGTVTALGDRILVKDESSGLKNGIYTVTTAGAIGVAAVLTRSVDMDIAAEFPGAFVFVESGTVNTAAGFVCTNSTPPTVGTTAITFTQFSGAGEITAGNGLSKSANTLTIDTAITADLSTAQTFTNKTHTSPKINENVAMTTTATKLNYLTSAGGTTGTTSTNIVFSTSPALTTPNIGVATATSVNKMAITAPATSSTLAVADGKTFTVSKTITLDGTDSTTMTFPSTSATIARTDAANTFTGIQTVTNVTLPTNGQILMTVPTSDGHATGPTCSAFVSGYSSSAVGDLVYLDSSSKWQKCDANTLLLYNGLLGIALAIAATDASLLVALPGSFVYATGFPTFTVGLPIYMSETAGAVTHTAPTTADAATRVIGWGIHADKMYFFPSPNYTTHV